MKQTKKPALKFNAKQLSKDIADKMAKDGVSFRDIAKATKDKLTPSTLQRITDQSQEPRVSTIADICNWLGKPVSAYF